MSVNKSWKQIDRGKKLRQLDPVVYQERLRLQILRNTSCWIWIGAHQVNGYGSTRVLGKVTPAHRAAYIAFFGDIPSGMEVCHTCDVRDCVNPHHLYIATHAENMRDVSIRGRGRGGICSGAYIPIRDSLGRFILGNGAENV